MVIYSGDEMRRSESYRRYGYVPGRRPTALEGISGLLKDSQATRDEKDYAHEQLNARLRTAARNGVVPMIEKLVKAGAQINALDPLERVSTAPLHEAAAHNKVEAIRVLVKLGADVNLPARPVGIALNTEDMPLRDAQRTANEDARVLAAYGDTPLHYAVKEGRVEATKVLLELKAKPAVKNSHGYTPLDCARNAEIINALESRRGSNKGG